MPYILISTQIRLVRTSLTISITDFATNSTFSRQHAFSSNELYKHLAEGFTLLFIKRSFRLSDQLSVATNGQIQK